MSRTTAPDPRPTNYATRPAADLSPALGDMVERRRRLLGPAYRLFYREPVEIARASGVFLYGSDGTEYLDAYNNVVPAGHCHPRIVRAIAAQMETLSTHTRYLQAGILDVSERLLATHAPGIGHVMFTCTGSEANDLALRIARHHTGRRGIVVTSEAYHGSSHLTAGLSPSLGERSPLGTWVRRIPTPDAYRRDPATLGAWMAARVAEEVEDLERHGDGVAALILDPVFSSDGIFAHPTDLLGPCAEVVRAAGGLVIADEVQSGFGRTGEAFWGYARHGVAPDMVTMGKPMGNGYPVAAVAMAPFVVASFGQDLRYFNTFGGNSVAVAAAGATLDVIEDEGLAANARDVGEGLRQGLRALMPGFGFLGDVRGSGLYVGAEIVQDDGDTRPDPERALRVVNEMRRRGVLLSSTGRHGNVLKIRPPLVFSHANADRLLTELEASFRVS